jgi:two-component system chemotaxis sensor kinase CheA
VLNRLSIRAKLTLLAGVPLMGVLALASLLWMQAQRGEKSAAALGSVDDLAELSVGLASLVQELQTERALGALVLGYGARTATDDPLGSEDPVQAKELAENGRRLLAQQRQATDVARARLQSFLVGRNLAGLPPRLRRDMQLTQETLESLSGVRAQIDSGGLTTTRNVEYFAGADLALIDATAALTQLSDDGELLRSISGLVSVMQVKERASQEHALLASVFAMGSFPPGTYRSFVSLTTEEQAYVDVLRGTASDESVRLYTASQESPEAKRARAMRQDALDNIEERVDASAEEWFRVQAKVVAALRVLELRLTAEVRSAAATKLADINSGRRVSLGLSGAALVLSTLLAWLIARGIDTSVGALTGAASKVQRDNDFSVRAVRSSNDELGELTTAFNQMLGGIQQRDQELDDYRQQLEQKVQVRTKALRERNAAMRLVLDNVDQGLATINKDGSLAPERSAAFDAWFGPASEDVTFANHIARRDPSTRDVLELAWDQVVEGFLPLDLTIGQMPGRLKVDDRRYSLGYKPILGGQGEFDGALLVVTDVTDEEARRLREAEQAEHIAVFEHLMQDRTGFISFFNEAERLLLRSREPGRSMDEVKRDIHTLKGNCAVYSIHGVALACHEVETQLEDVFEFDPNVLAPIAAAWTRFAETAKPLMGSSDGLLAVERRELDAVLDAVRARSPYSQLQSRLERLEFEPVAVRFFRAGEQAKRLARKLGKPDPKIVSEPNDVRLRSGDWAPFWGAFTHVVQNAVDHGLEGKEARLAAGKPAAGTLRLRASTTGDGVRIELHDDGRGVDWEKVRKRAIAMNLPARSPGDLVQALFADSLTTRDATTTTSGRGVGLAAVRTATRALQGRVDVESKPGFGTKFIFEFEQNDVLETEGSQRIAAGASGRG